MTAKQLEIIITAQNREFNTAINGVISRLDDMEERTRHYGDSATGVFKKIAQAASALGIGKIISDSIMSGGELEQNLGGAEVVFQQHAESMKNTAKTAFKDMGLSESGYLAAANKMGALLKGSGFDIASAADMSQQVMQRASDVASIMGIDVSSAMEAVTGAAKGNFTMMDNLGVAVNDTTLQIYAQEKGLDTSRGYATGMITSQTWTYHGSHRIKCSLPSSLVYSGEESAVMLLADDSGEATATEPAERVQPKSQLEKRLDAVEAIAGGDGKLHDVYGTSSVGELVGDSSVIGLYIRDNNGNNSFKIVNHSAAIEFSSSHGGLVLNSAGNEIKLSGSAGQLLINLTQSAGRLTFTPKSGYGDSLQITAGTGEAEISIGNCTLSLRADELYYNKQKVLLESN